MAGTSVLKLKVDDKEYNASLRQAQQGMQHLEQALQAAGKTFNQVDKSVVEYARGIGQMEAQSKTARGRIGEMTSAFVEFSTQYNKMSADMQKSDVGKALSQSIDQLRQRTIAAKQELEDLNRQLANTKTPDIGSTSGGFLSGLGDKMGGAIQVFAGNILTKAAGAVANLGSEMVGLVQQGIELAKQGEGIRIAFERLGRGDILNGLREATHGTVTDLELMKAAVKFNDFKLPVEELGTMLAFAQQKAKDTGQSVDYMVDSIVTGLGRKSLMILDNLGLSASEIKERMAETGDMTKAVGAIIREQMAKSGDYVETAADRAQQANVSMQNKMEELGRKFAPLQEASSNFWTSMKIGILDVVGGPLAKLLNGLTEAGRMMNAYNKMGGSGKVGRMTANLAGASEGNRQNIYQQQQEKFWRYINPREQQIKDIRAWQSGQRGEALQGRIGAIRDQYGSLDATKIQAEVDAAKKMLSDYQQAAKKILSPVKPVIDTSETEQSITSLTKKLKDLQEQRKKAIAAGDTELSKSLSKQITQTKADIKGLGGSITTSTTGGKSPHQQAEDKVAAALLDYNQTIEKASLELKSGVATEADVKKKQLSAQERLYDAYGDAYALYKDPKYKEAQDRAAEEIVKLGGEVKASAEAQKKAQEAARELETAQKKLADAQLKLAEAQESGDLKQIYAAEKNVQNAQSGVNLAQANLDSLSQSVTVEVLPKWAESALNALPQEIKDKLSGKTDVPIPLTTANLDAFIANTKEQIASSDLGSGVVAKLQESLSDATAIGEIMKTALKNGIDTADFDTTGLMQKLLNGEDIDDATIQSYVDKLNALLKEKFDETEWPKVLIKFDVNSKEISTITNGLKNDSNKLASSWSAAAAAISAVGNAMSAIEDPTLKVMGTIAQAVASIALGAAQAIAQAGNGSAGGPWGWIAFAAAATATMITTIASVHKATGYANGGIVDGRDGGFVGGMSYSGDNVGNVRLNSGELVLNHAQQNNLANELEGNVFDDLQLDAHVTAEDIIFILNNNGNRRGYGNFIND